MLVMGYANIVYCIFISPDDYKIIQKNNDIMHNKIYVLLFLSGGVGTTNEFECY